MKILHLSSERTWRGGEQQIAYLIEELQNENVHCFVACRKNSAFESYCKKNLIDHVSLPFANEFDIITALRIKGFCKYIGIDLVHLHSSHSHAIGVWSHLLGNNLPIILSRRVDFPIKNNFLSRFKYNYDGIKKIICVSETIKEIVSKDVKDRSKCVTVYSGIDPNKFKGKTNQNILREEYKIPANYAIIANTSAIAPHKDHFTFVNTAEELIRQKLKAKFFIIGAGPSYNEIANYIEQKQLQQHIYMTGFRDDIPGILPEIDIFLMTSKTEGLGTTILDAFANKIPVVATRAGGIPEIVINEKTGLTVEIKDYRSLAQCVICLLNDERLTKRLTENAFNSLKHFTKEKIAEKTLEIYKELLV